MKKIIGKKSYFATLLLCIFLFSCSEKKTVGLLQQAQAIVEINPKKALILLDSIPNPQDLDKDNYMQYIVAHVQAKYKCYKDITTDTLIFEAQRYFEYEENYNQAALASFYSAGVCKENNELDKAYKHYQETKRNALKANNIQLLGMAEHNIGDLYFDENIMDSAATHYKKAIISFNKSGDKFFELQSIYFIGRVYRALNKSDSALYVFNKGLELAKQANSEAQEALFHHNISIEYRANKEYPQAKEYLNKAITSCKNIEDSLRIYLSYSKLYKELNQPDSVSHYLGFIEQRLSEITYARTLRNMYGELHSYYKQNGNPDKAIQYQTLHSEIDKQMQKANHADQLIAANTKYQLSLKDKELMKAQQMHLYFIISMTICIALIAFLWFRHKHQKQKERNRLLSAENKLLESRNALLEKEANMYQFLKNIFHTVTDEWRVIDNKIYQMALQYGAVEKPALFVEIEQIITTVQEKINDQLIEWAKNNLEAGIISALNDREILYFMFRSSGFVEGEINQTFPFSTYTEQSCFKFRYIIRNKLKSAGSLTPEIETLLLGKNSILVNQKPPTDPYRINF